MLHIGHLVILTSQSNTFLTSTERKEKKNLKYLISPFAPFSKVWLERFGFLKHLHPLNL